MYNEYLYCIVIYIADTLLSLDYLLQTSSKLGSMYYKIN